MSTKIARAQITSEGYIELQFLQEDFTLGIKEVSYGWELAQKLNPEKKLNVYLKTARWSLLDKEARTFVIKQLKSWPNVAILVHHLGQRLMGNFAVNLTGKSRNIRIFEDDAEAIAWLLEKQV